MSATKKFHQLISNLVYVQFDRDRALSHWNTMANFMAEDAEAYGSNRAMIVSNKTVAGILGHRRSRGFHFHLLKERRIIRRNP